MYFKYFNRYFKVEKEKIMFLRKGVYLYFFVIDVLKFMMK